ncbi:hypothetical protein CHLRE_10g425050v5 [Chlamydomonas reinhardtii]|uniref:Uncharacterized protein n=1 Tax=Chlamydomonas reinhardtii TaxID=3055 RepID=A0A2K3D9G3_CHLRE|nr:uncharacterized protein CHLRE_10g425050v5 [Chlamydomonas reinhardtii]PNW77166.1 hypothetical protein CHLRE_10g425050v5 [Chlamydomonas reinhardtii]
MARAQSGLHQLLLAREIGVVGSQEGVPYQRSLHFPPHYAGKLSVAHTYNGHSGCVNRLAWNADGSLLVSGSDDRRAIIWHHPEVERTPLALSTEHRANIFGVQFLPCTGDRRVITGAMDDTVQLHDLEASPATNIPRPGSAGGSRAQPPMHRRVASTAHLQSVMPRTKVYYSHKDRVKDVRVEPMNPHNFWSGGEDGVVRQYDTRQPNQDKWESPTVLVQVRDGHKTIQVKSLDINKAHPHLLAVAGSDPQIRLYDRRKLSTGGWQRRGATPAVMALAPPHLPLAAAPPRHGRSHATYVAFSNRGDKLVTTYHGDHAYCFDITASGDVSALFPDPAAALGVGIGAAAPPAAGGVSRLLLVPQRQQSVTPSGRHSGEAGGNGDRRDSGGGSSGGSGSASPLCPRAEEAKARGNAAMFERKWTAAVVAFTDALHWAPGAPALYAQRAEALLGRGWVGDAAMALRDCDTAVGLDESFSRAYLRRIHALQALQQYQCALTAVDEYQRRFPGRAADDVAALAVTLRAAVEERRRLYEARRQQQERRRAQRAAALARVQGRVDSPAVRPQMPGAATTSTTAAGAGAAGAARGAAPAAAAGAAAAAAPAAAATTSAAAGSGAAAAAAGSSTDYEMDDSEVYGPPPPPPYEFVEEEADQEASAGAAQAPAGADEAVSTASGAGHRDELRAGTRQVGTGEGTAVGAEQATPTQRPPAAATSVGEQAAAGPSTSAVGVSVGASSPRELTQQQSSARTPAAEAGPAGNAEERGAAAAGPSGSDAAAAGPDGHTRAAAGAAGPSADAEGSASAAETPAAEAEAEAAARAAAGRGRPPETASDALGPARRFLRSNEEDDDEDDDEEAPEEEDEEEEEEEDTTDVDSLPGEEDPDMELFLQYYSRVMDMAGASGSAGASKAAARHGHHSGTSTSAAAPAASGCDGRRGGYRIRGAWDGTPGGRRMLQRFVGQSNVQTDIKEVGFIGSDDAVVAAGSDCGRVYLYDAASGAVLRALPADEDVANCVQCHPSLPVIATSGIETVVRLWSPSDALPSPAAVRELTDELDGVVGRNQERMKEGPSMLRTSALQQALQENPQLWQLLMSQLYGRGVMGARGRPGSGGGGGAAAPGAAEEPGGEDDDEEDAHPEVSCRMA